MIIRQAALSDSAAIGKVQLESWRTMFPDAGIAADDYLAEFSDEERAQDWEELLSALPENHFVYVATDDSGFIVGFTLAERISDPQATHASELSVIHVLPEYRNRGIGQQLIAAIAQRLKQEGCASLWLWTLTRNPARRLYQRLGGTLIREETKMIGKNETGIEITEVAYGWADINQLINACQ